MTQLVDEWSATKLSTVHACLRKFFYRYVLDMGEPASSVQEYGKGAHRGLEAWLRNHHEGADVRLTAAIAAIDLTDPWDAAKARAIMVGYEVRWGDVRWAVLAVEIQFRFELDGHIIHGQIDAIVQDEIDGRVYVVEHKNTVADTSPGSSYWEVLTIDRQVSIYVDAAAMLGYDVSGCIYDAIGRPKHERQLATPAERRKFTKGKGCKVCRVKAGEQGRGFLVLNGAELSCAACKGSGWEEAPRLYADQRDTDETVDAFEQRVAESIAENPDAFYQRSTVVRTEDELPKMRLDILNTVRLARMCHALEMWPRGNSHACRSGGHTCHFLPLCSGSADPSDTVRFPRRSSEQAPDPKP